MGEEGGRVGEGESNWEEWRGRRDKGERERARVAGESSKVQRFLLTPTSFWG